MTDEQQISAFEDDVSALIARYIDEFDLSIAAMVGVLEVQKHILIKNAMDQLDEEDEEE